MAKANMNCGSCVCDNDSMCIFGDCPSNELIVIKIKETCWNFHTHAKMFRA